MYVCTLYAHVYNRTGMFTLSRRFHPNKAGQGGRDAVRKPGIYLELTSIYISDTTCMYTRVCEHAALLIMSASCGFYAAQTIKKLINALRICYLFRKFSAIGKNKKNTLLPMKSSSVWECFEEKEKKNGKTNIQIPSKSHPEKRKLFFFFFSPLTIDIPTAGACLFFNQH